MGTMTWLYRRHATISMRSNFLPLTHPGTATPAGDHARGRWRKTSIPVSSTYASFSGAMPTRAARKVLRCFPSRSLKAVFFQGVTVPPPRVANGRTRVPEFRGDFALVDVGGLTDDRVKPRGLDFPGLPGAFAGRKPFAAASARQPVRMAQFIIELSISLRFFLTQRHKGHKGFLSNKSSESCNPVKKKSCESCQTIIRFVATT